MTAQPLIVVGAGGFGRELLDVVDAINTSHTESVWRVLGVADDDPSPANLDRLAARAVRYLGPIDTSLASAPADVCVAIGVGSPAARRTIADLIDSCRTASYPVLVHPRAHVGSQASLGPGTVICGGAQVSTNVQTGRHVQLNPNATIGHDTVLGEFVSVNPGGIVSGECSIDDGALVGAGSVILQGLRLEARSTVGAAACVVRDVPARAVVKGVPAS